MIPHIACFVFLNVAGHDRRPVDQRGIDVGRVRKMMQTIGFGGVATALMIVGYVHNAPTPRSRS